MAREHKPKNAAPPLPDSAWRECRADYVRLPEWMRQDNLDDLSPPPRWQAACESCGALLSWDEYVQGCPCGVPLVGQVQEHGR